MTDVKFDQKSKAFKEIKWIPVKNLSVVWAQSQRNLNDRHAQSISNNFDPELFGLLSVTKPNGHGVYHIIDGQHRKVAVESMWGKEELVPCQVFDVDSPARAAKMFDAMTSNRRAMQPIELFKIRVTAQEELQVNVNKVIIDQGYFVGQNAENSIACVQALEAVYKSYGPTILKYVLKLVKETWGDDKSATTGILIRGFGMFLSEFRNCDLEKLSRALAAKYTPARFLGAAKAGREVNGTSAVIAVRDLTIATYNTTVRSANHKLRSVAKK